MSTSRSTFDNNATASDPSPSRPTGERAVAVPEWLRFLELTDVCTEHTCTEQQVRDAYKRKAHACHPDQGGDAAAFRQLTDHYKQALKHVASRRSTTGEYQAVLIDSLRYVRTSEGRLAGYGRHILVAVGVGLLISWYLDFLLPAVLLVGVCCLLILPSVTAPLRPVYAGSVFLGLVIATFLYLLVGLQSGAFFEEGYFYEMVALILACLSMMTLFAWLISLADHNR